MGESARILIVDANVTRSELVAKQFGVLENWTTTVVGTGVEALEYCARSAVDLVILDQLLPDIDGRELCRQIRALRIDCPVIMTSNDDADALEILAMDAGTNDYMVRPFSLGKLVAHVRSHLRYYDLFEDQIHLFASFVFRPARNSLSVIGARKISLTETESSLLKHLYFAAGKTVSRTILLQRVWGHSPETDTHMLDSHVYRLRRKIEEDPSNPSLLLTKSGGYSLRSDSST